MQQVKCSFSLLASLASFPSLQALSVFFSFSEFYKLKSGKLKTGKKGTWLVWFLGPKYK